MAKQIDERVVEMRFDNSDFMKKVKPTISSLEKLKESLKLQDATKGFDAMQQAANKVDMKGLGSAVDGVKERFSALEAVALGALTRIGSQIAGVAERMLSSFTVAPIADGYREYELKLNSIQTIMNATGEDLDTVNRYLDELNTYADKTIYSFSDMTGAIGKFTSSGVDLDTSVKAIQGVSNAVAYAGLGADAASSAFYNFSQALATGYLGLQDYKSVGMTYQIVNSRFREELVKTALDMGTLVDKGDHYVTTTTNAQGKTAELAKDLSAFQYSLNAQWVTSDVLVETLKKYSDTETELGQAATEAATKVKTFTQLIGTVREAIGSGWARTWELLIGDLEEAKGLWTSVNDVIGEFINKQSDARNKLFETWKALGGRQELFEGFQNIYKAIMKIITPIANAFREVFGERHVTDLLKISHGFKELTSALIISDDAASLLHTTFKILFRVIKAGLDVISKIFGGIVYLGQQAFNAISPMVQEFEKFLIELRNSGKAQQYLEDIVNWFIELGEICAPYVEYVIKEVQDFATELENLISPEITNFLATLERYWNDLVVSVDGVDFSTPIKAFESLKKLWDQLLYYLSGNNSLNHYIENLIAYLNRFKEAFSFDNVMGNATDNIQSFQDKFGQFTKWLQEKIEPLKALFGSISIGDVAAVGTGAGIIYFITKVAKAFGEGAEKLKALPEVFESIGGALKAYQDKLKAERLKEIAKAILILSAALVILSFADMDKVFGAAIALSVIGGALALAVNKLDGVFRKGKTLDDAAYKFAESFNVLAKAVKWKAIGSALKDFGETIIMIALSIAGLALMYERNPESMEKATKLVGEIALAMVAMIAALEFISERLSKGARSIATVGIGVFALSSALYIAVKALDKIFNLQIPDDYKSKLMILAGVFLGLIVVARAVAKTNAESVKGGKNKEILALTVMLFVSVLALEKLFKIELPLDYESKLAILAGIYLGLGYVAKSIGKASKNAGGALKAGGTILSMAIFMGVTVKALEKLVEIDADRLNQAAIVFGGILLALSESIKNASKGAESSKDQYKTILSMALTVGVIALALGGLAMIPMESLAKSTIALGAVLLALSNAFKNVSDVKNNKTTMDTIIAMIIAVVAIAGSLYALGKMDWKSLLAGAVGIKLVLEEFTQSASVLSSKKGLNAFKIMDFLFMFVALVPICIALAALAYVPWEGVLAGVVGIKLVLEAFVKALESISGMGKDSASWGTIIKFFVMTLLELIPITIALGILANQPWEGLLAAAVAIDLVLAAMTGVLTVLTLLGSKTSKALVGILGLTLLLLPMLGVMLMIKELAAMNPESLIAAAEAISMVMGAMVVALGVCTLAGLACPAALIGLGSLYAVIKVLKNLMIKLGELFQDPNVEAFLDKGAEIMAKIGAAIGDFIGNLIGGAISSAMMQIASDLPQLATHLSDFATNLQPFIVGIQQVNQDCISAVKSLVSLILLMTAADLIDGISDFFSFFTGDKSLSKFASQLSEFMPFFKDFANQTDGIDGQNVKNCAEAMVYLFKSFAEIPNSGGVISWFTGDNVLTTEYAESVGAMGEALKKFYDQTNSVNKTKIDDSASAMVVLFKAFSEMPNTGGLLGDIVGNNDISEQYADQMVAMAVGLKDYSNNVLTVKKDKVVESAEAMRAVFQAFSQMPNSGGLLGDIVGNNDISELYADQMVDMAIGLKNYSDNVLTVKKDKVIESATAMKSLFQAFSEIPNDGGIIGWFTGNNDIATFGESLKAFGGSFAEYYTSISEINFGTLSQAIGAFRSLIEVSNAIANMGNMYAIEDFAASLSRIGSDCVDGFIEAFEDTYSVTTGLTTFLTNCTTTLDTFNTNFFTSGQKSVEQWTLGWGSENVPAQEAVRSLMTSILLILTLSANSFYIQGNLAGDEYLKGIRDKYLVAPSVGKTLANNVLTGLRGVIDSFYSVGSTCGQGFVNGLKDMLDEASDAGRQIGEAALKAAKKAVDSNSPSKKFIKLGEDSGQGMVIGIGRSLMAIARAGEQMGDTVVDSTEGSLTTVKTILDDGIIVDPVIRPRVDTSAVEASVEEIRKMFNNTIALTTEKAGVISGSVSRIRSQEVDGVIQNQRDNLTGNVNYIFNQTNNSPKALSRVEIYRQTNNLFSRAAERINRG